MKKSSSAMLMVVGVAAGAAYFFYFLPSVTVAPPVQESGAVATSTKEQLPRTPPQGQKEYRSAHYRFAIFYPDTLAVSEYDEGGGARTFVFANADESQSFQVFVVPYAEQQISAQRFALDQPSGVIEQPTEVVIDAVPATMFFSSNAVMGETREVWFIRGGYLFEVTTYKALDEWFSQVMSSWQFL